MTLIIYFLTHNSRDFKIYSVYYSFEKIWYQSLRNTVKFIDSTVCWKIIWSNQIKSTKSCIFKTWHLTPKKCGAGNCPFSRSLPVGGGRGGGRCWMWRTSSSHRGGGCGAISLQAPVDSPTSSQTKLNPASATRMGAITSIPLCSRFVSNFLELFFSCKVLGSSVIISADIKWVYLHYYPKWMFIRLLFPRIRHMHISQFI